MSHIATIQVSIKSLPALQAACNRLGFQFMEGQKTYEWFRTYVGDSRLPSGVRPQDLGKCDHAVRVPGATYEVGVVDNHDGTYSLRWDSWQSGGLVKVLGEGAQRLIQAYSVAASIEAATLKGYSYYTETLEDQSIKLHIRVGE